MYGRDDDFEEQNRQILFQGTAALERTSESLARSTQIAIETETIGNEVVSELDSQRQSLLRSKNRLEDANEQLTSARRTLQKMGRNVVYNKLLLIGIIILEIAILAAICYLKFLRQH
ncbi:vesicle transport through interaction with t-SNAREs homolog 1B [Diorhabda carinulata]|uniref:vesicle transport through interaction with t-SNAREs homolog 1B n=1 Tax=Diorhabda sublineata TaxID=1163346 RepID=UPI0024E130D9|nr:vesicle transport through interaction with t-SNAREs homolog 1B [Diorhabda sublineata]XP_057656387.1 vesicle transport through interaction with t-SNAREs homolog 1B [Diorhabda carinulata]